MILLRSLLGGLGDRQRQRYTYRTASPPEGFEDYFGDRYGQPDDTEAAVALTFSEAFNGVQKRFQLGDETITVRIPPGAKPGSRLRIRGKGQVSPFSGQRGDLYLTIEFAAPFLLRA